MAYRLVISRRADEQLDSIIEYVAVRLNNPTAAAAILSDVEAIYCTLREMPESMALCEDPYLASKEYHKAILRKHNYVVLFKICEYEVRIAGIFHTLEDYTKEVKTNAE